jgi:transcriptional regulator with XRE-family HTH domain
MPGALDTRPPESYTLHELAQRLGANIRRARCDQGLSQEHVAEAIGMTLEKYECMEQGTLLPSVETFTALYHALGAPLDDLLGPPNPRPPGSA